MCCALILIGSIRIVSTYPVFGQTYDEPGHIGAGMEWLQKGEYTFAVMTPPLARILPAIGLYAVGIRLPEDLDLEGRAYPKWISWQDTHLAKTFNAGNEVLHSGGAYDRNLALARLGVLPFFIVATLFVWIWSRELYGDGTAIIATALFSSLPPVLAHSGLATADMALACTFFVSLYFFVKWLPHPTLKNGFWLGLATAMAFLSKMSAFVLLPATFFVILVFFLFSKTQSSRHESTVMKRAVVGSLALIMATCFFFVWAGYRFSFGPVLDQKDAPQERIDAKFAPGSVANNAARLLLETPLPAPELIKGIKLLRFYNAKGRWSNLLGEFKKTGWWYFFIVAIGAKTPIPFLLFSIIGGVMMTFDCWRYRGIQSFALILALATILAITAQSKVTYGLRHVLAVYPIMAIISASAIFKLWQTARYTRQVRAALVLLCAWFFTGSMIAHPDYLAYFNEIAGDHPAAFLAENDLDWGQDLKRLSIELEALKVKKVWVALNSSAFLERLLPGDVKYLEPNVHKSGWIAISAWRKVYGSNQQDPNDGYVWLESYQPVRKIGKSIYLYHIEGPKIDNQ